MIALLLVLLLLAILFGGFGVAVNALWWIAVFVIVCIAVGALTRGRW